MNVIHMSSFSEISVLRIFLLFLFLFFLHQNLRGSSDLHCIQKGFEIDPVIRSFFCFIFSSSCPVD
jgi:hypothetical protein